MFSLARTILLAIAALCTPLALRAQVVPELPPGWTTAEAIQVFQTNPQFRSLVFDRLLDAGLTAEEIRDQLVAAGFPPTQVELYLAERGLTVGAGRTPPPPALAPADTIAAPDSMLVRDSSAADRGIGRGSSLPVFGLDVFTTTTSSFDPLMTGPIDDSYVIGPGDGMTLILTGVAQASFELEVTRQGFVVIPNVGQVFVSGLTLAQFNDVAFDRLRNRYASVGRGPNAATTYDVIVTRVRAQTVRVLGEVNVPGSYNVSAAGGVLTALYHAGGLTPRASFRTIEIMRGATRVATVDLYDFLLRGILTQEVRLLPGDVVFVPIRGPRVKIAGEVMRPAEYELQEGETLRDLVAMAGGLTPLASTTVATIDRVLPPADRPEAGNARRVISVTLDGVADTTAARIAMLPADSVTVFPVRGGRRNTVLVEGSVWQPGSYELDTGMRLWDLIRSAGGLRPDTYAGRAQVTRLRADSTRQMFGVVLDSTSLTDPATNPVLLEADNIRIFSRTSFRAPRFVRVHGAIRREGPVEFADSMTLRDAILLADGLTDDAYLLEAEIARIRPNAGDSPDSLVTLFRVPLDSTFVVGDAGYVRRPVGASRGPTFLLHPYDRVFVRRQPGWEVQRTVVVSGEVAFPGTYSLATRDERLASLIGRAGGLRLTAYPAGIRFHRTENAIGRIAVDLPAVMADGARRDNLILAPGDSIHIPRYIPTVRVDGAVNFPTSVTFVAGADVGYYLDAAGGTTFQADRGDTYVQQPSGQIERGRRPEPGATIFVPSRDPGDRGIIQFVPLFTAMVQVFAATATLIVALSR